MGTWRDVYSHHSKDSQSLDFFRAPGHILQHSIEIQVSDTRYPNLSTCGLGNGSWKHENDISHGHPDLGQHSFSDVPSGSSWIEAAAVDSRNLLHNHKDLTIARMLSIERD